VPPGAHELTVDVEWGDYHPEANLYLELFRPGHDPANSEDDPGPTRTFPVAESAGLVTPTRSSTTSARRRPAGR
jgi:hypothetical protein